MKLAIGFIAGLTVFMGIGWFLFPWVFTTVKGLFENPDIGTLVAIVALLPTAGIIFAIGEFIGLVVFFVLEKRK